MSSVFTLCYACDHIAAHKALRKCEECGSTDVYVDVDTEYDKSRDEEEHHEVEVSQQETE